MMTSVLDGNEPIFLDVERALDQIGEVSALHGMLDMLQDTLDRDVPEIARLLAARDMLAVNRLLHALKGFIPIFCVDAMCDHVAQVESLSKSGSAEAVAQAYASLAPKLQRLQTEIDLYLG